MMEGEFEIPGASWAPPVKMKMKGEERASAQIHQTQSTRPPNRLVAGGWVGQIAPSMSIALSVTVFAILLFAVMAADASAFLNVQRFLPGRHSQ
jgi:hypothetical protein